jgi:hypothetical protein
MPRGWHSLRVASDAFCVPEQAAWAWSMHARKPFRAVLFGVWTDGWGWRDRFARNVQSRRHTWTVHGVLVPVMHACLLRYTAAARLPRQRRARAPVLLLRSFIAVRTRVGTGRNASHSLPSTCSARWPDSWDWSATWRRVGCCGIPAPGIGTDQ